MDAGRQNGVMLMARLKAGARTCLLVVVVMGVVAIKPEAVGDDWNRFRGPNGSGVIEATGLPLDFGPETNVVWKTTVAPGFSSPVISGDRLLLTAFENDQLITTSLDRQSGRMLWRQTVERTRVDRPDSRNHSAAASAAVDAAGNVYVFFGEFGLVAYDREGVEQWRHPLGPFDNIYGMGASPIVADNLVLLACDQQNGSFLLAVDADTGEVRWKVDRPEAKSGHSSPVLYDPPDGPLQVLVAGSFLLTAYDVATGEKRWWVGGLPFEMKSTPVMDGDTLYIHGFSTPLNQQGRQVEVDSWEDTIAVHDANGDNLITPDEFPQGRTRGFFSFVDLDGDGQLDEDSWNYYRAAMMSLNGMVAIRLGGSGDMTEENVVWRYHRSVPQLPSPLLYQGVLYMINDGGIATSFRPSTGEVIERGRIRGAVDSYYASPVAADGKIFFVSEMGKVAVVRPGGGFEVLALNDLGSPAYATPAIADGRIYIRTEETLWAFGED